MSSEAIVEWVHDVLLRHDPVGAWEHVRAVTTYDYALESLVVADRLSHVLGFGHIVTLIADSIDQNLPGFYEASTGRSDVRQRTSHAARELWDGREAHTGQRLGQPRPAVKGGSAPTIPPLPSPEALVAEGDCIEPWLRRVEDGLAGEPNRFTDPGPWTLALRAELPAIVDAYTATDNDNRAAMRLAFSRFCRALHALSGTVAGELSAMAGAADPLGALRRGLMAESLLDMGTDWRDETLALQDARTMATAAGLNFVDAIEEAAAASSDRTAEFLRGFVREGG